MDLTEGYPVKWGPDQESIAVTDVPEKMVASSGGAVAQHLIRFAYSGVLLPVSSPCHRGRLRRNPKSQQDALTTFLMLSSIARFFTSRTGSYELLPTNASGGQTSSNPSSSPDGPGLRARLLLHSRLIQRIGAFFLITMLGLLAVRWYYRWPREFSDEEYHGLPTYREIREYERNLPQHDLNLPWPEGKNGYAAY